MAITTQQALEKHLKNHDLTGFLSAIANDELGELPPALLMRHMISKLTSIYLQAPKEDKKILRKMLKVLKEHGENALGDEMLGEALKLASSTQKALLALKPKTSEEVIPDLLAEALDFASISLGADLLPDVGEKNLITTLPAR